MCSHIHDKRQKWQKYMHSSLKGIIIIFLCSKIFTFILDITSHPNLFSVFHYEIKKIVPICVAKSFQIETSDLKSLIPPAVFDPITSNPNQFSFNINLQINRSQFELFFTTQSNLNPRCSLFSSQKKVGPELQSSKWGFPSSRSRRASIGFSALFSCFAGCG